MGRPFTAMRRREFGVGPLLVMLSMLLLLVTRDLGSLSGRAALAMLLVAALLTAWSFLVPVVAIRKGRMVWRITPFRKATVVSLSSIVSAELLESAPRLEIHMSDSSTISMPVDRMSQADIDRIVSVLNPPTHSNLSRRHQD